MFLVMSQVSVPVLVNVSNQKLPLFPPKRTKTRQQFLALKNDPHIFFSAFLLHFYVTIFPIPTQNCKKKFWYQYFAMIFPPNSSKFLKICPPTKIFTATRKSQTATNLPNRHFYQHCCTHLWIFQTALLCIKWRKYGYDQGLGNDFYLGGVRYE